MVVTIKISKMTRMMISNKRTSFKASHLSKSSYSMAMTSQMRREVTNLSQGFYSQSMNKLKRPSPRRSLISRWRILTSGKVTSVVVILQAPALEMVYYTTNGKRRTTRCLITNCIIKHRQINAKAQDHGASLANSKVNSLQSSN